MKLRKLLERYNGLNNDYIDVVCDCAFNEEGKMYCGTVCPMAIKDALRIYGEKKIIEFGYGLTWANREEKEKVVRLEVKIKGNSIDSNELYY